MSTSLPFHLVRRACRAGIIVALFLFPAGHAGVSAAGETPDSSLTTTVLSAFGLDSLAAAGQAPVSAPGAAARTAVLRIGNRDIVEFRGSFLGYGPEERAKAAAKRINTEVRSRGRDVTDMRVEARQTGEGWLFFLDGRWVFGLTPADVDVLGDQALPQLVEQTRANLEAAVTASLQQRSFKGLFRSILFSVLATAIYWALIRGLIRLMRWSRGRVDRSIERRAQQAHLPPSALTRQMTALTRLASRLLIFALWLLLTDIWITFVLKQFPYTYPWGDQIDDHLIKIGTTVGLSILRAIPSVVMLAVIFFIARIVIRYVRAFFDAVREGRIDPPGLDPDTAMPAQRLATMFLWLLAFAIAYPFIPGSGGTAFKGISVLAGLMISLGSSSVVSQAASGYLLMFSRALRVGDFVRIGEYEGTVLSLGVVSTKIRTARDEEINVPNNVVLGTSIKNYTRLNKESGVPVTTSVTIGYNAPWRQIHAMLLDAAKRTPGLRTDPAPRVIQSALSDFYVEYTLFARLEVPEGRALVLSALHGNIQDVFNEYGVQIMSPHYEGDPDGKVWVPREKWYDAPAHPEEPGSAAPAQRKESQ